MATCGGKRNYQFLIYSITHHFPVTVNKLKLPHEMGSRFFSVLRSFSKKKQEGNHSIAFACVTFSDKFFIFDFIQSFVDFIQSTFLGVSCFLPRGFSQGVTGTRVLFDPVVPNNSSHSPPVSPRPLLCVAPTVFPGSRNKCFQYSFLVIFFSRPDCRCYLVRILMNFILEGKREF